MSKHSLGVRVLNTLFNPLTEDTVTPSWFHPLSDVDYRRFNDSLFHAITLLATYGSLGYGYRTLRELTKTDKNKKKLNNLLQSRFRAEKPLFSPDPDVHDVETIKPAASPFLLKKADETVKHVTDSGSAAASSDYSPLNYMGLYLPALAAYTAFMYGGKKADEQIDKNKEAALDANIKHLNNVYDRVSLEKLLSAKGLSRDEIKRRMATMGMNKTANEKEDPQLKKFREAVTSRKDSMPKSLAAIMFLMMGGLSYGAYKLTSEVLERNDPNTRKYKMLKKEIARREMSRKPVKIIPKLDPRVSAILNKPLEKNITPSASAYPPAMPENKPDLKLPEAPKNVSEPTSAGSLSDLLKTI